MEMELDIIMIIAIFKVILLMIKNHLESYVQ
jgi:hypothetical protein